VKLVGQIEKIIYENDGFFIALLSSGEKISGSYHDSSVKSIEKAAVTLEGDFVEHPRYGKTFSFHTLRVNQHELFFFLNRVVGGFPKRVTAELIEHFGEKGLIDILDNDIEKLKAFSGIGEKRLERIQGRWKRFRSMRELGSFLAPLGVTPAVISTIAGAMKEVSDPVAALKKNPYVLMNIGGIGFRRADEIALKTGIGPRDDRRIAAAMEHAVALRCEREGNSCLGRKELFETLDTLLRDETVRNEYETALLERIAEGSIVVLDDGTLSPARLYEAEAYLYETFRRRSAGRDEPIVEDLDAFLESTELALGAQQRQAVETVNTGLRMFCLVGYAGTGKSTTSRTMLELLSRRYGRAGIVTCALSGIAAQRIGDTTGFESATIQSLLVRYEERDAMPYGVVLVDEASMINSTLFARLLSKCRRDAVVILVGDDAQLPPIGAGNVLADVIACGIVPVVKLTRIYRQSEEQALAFVADGIRRGEPPDFSAAFGDFRFDGIPDGAFPGREAHAEAVLGRIVEAAIEHIPRGREYLKDRNLSAYLRDFQVISPRKGGPLGTENLNRVLQEYFNPSPRKKVVRGETEFRLMDKVVHVRNDNLPSWTLAEYREKKPSGLRRIYNGMAGLLFRIDTETEQVHVVYPAEELVVSYDFTQTATHLMLSYALTVHKVQGMEYETVVMPVTSGHAPMLTRPLLYTAVTRAKRLCCLVGEREVLVRAIRREKAVTRRTVLRSLACRHKI